MAGNKPGPKKGDPRMVEAGRKGAATLREMLGEEGYKERFKEIGKLGGKATKERYGPAFYSQIGQKGGTTVKRERGIEYYTSIGRKGGSANRRKKEAKNG